MPAKKKKPAAKLEPKFYALDTDCEIMHGPYGSETEARKAARVIVVDRHKDDEQPFEKIMVEVVRVLGGSRYSPPTEDDPNIVDF
jgi:hypothetical protein